MDLLDAALDEADSTDESDDDDSLPDADLVLARSLLSCLASLAFLGGVRDLQAAGGVLQVLKLMRHTDETIRSYAAACTPFFFCNRK